MGPFPFSMDHRELTIITRLLGSDVKKPTALVHFQRNMSAVAQRIMTLLIFNTQESEPDSKGHYDIRAKFVQDFLGWTDSKNYERIYDAFREIKGNDIVWNFLGEDRTLDELHCSFLITLGISRRSGVIRYKLHPELLPIIRSPNVFAKLKLIMLAVLAQPKYAYPLYEFVADAYCRGKLVEQISLVRLKSYLGIPATSYTDYVTFKDQVLKPALAAINRIADYAVSYTTYREGRRVAGVVLRIERKAQWQQPLLLEKPMEILRRYFGAKHGIAPTIPTDDADTRRFVQKIARYGIGERTARAAIAAHGLQGAREIARKVVRDVRRREKSAHPVKNVPAYLARCLRDGFGKLTAEERRVETEANAKRMAQERAATEHKQAEAAKADADAAWKREVSAHLDALPETKLEELRIAFVEEIESGKHGDAAAAAFRAASWKAAGIKSLFRIFAAKKIPSKRP